MPRGARGTVASESILAAYHIRLDAEHLAGNGGIGRYVFLPGDRSRAARIAERFEDAQTLDNPRGLTAHLGRLAGVDVLSISSGMGPSSVEIVVHELLLAGARRIVRVGSSGSLNAAVPPGSVVIATSAVRDESTSDRWVPKDVPAVAHPAAVAAIADGARAAGLAEHAWLGPVHSKDSLFGREYAVGPRRAENERYMEQLSAAGVLATEMEASILFVLAAVASAASPTPLSAGSSPVPVQTAAVLAVYGKVGSPETRAAEARAIEVACSGVIAWARADGVL